MALQSEMLPYAGLVECRVNGEAETIVFDVAVERPQLRSLTQGMGVS